MAKVLLGAVVLLFGAASAAAQTSVPSPELVEQIRALHVEKAARTPAQRKLASALLHARKMRQGLPIAAGIATLRSDVEVETDGRVLVDLRADVTPRVLARIEELGGAVQSHFAGSRAIRARVPLDALETLAQLSEVHSIRPADRAVTRAINVSEGDVAHRAAAARSSFGVDGTGIDVGVLSDGVDALASLQASGDLPPGVSVLSGQAGSGNEGAAMLEIVHDLAPGAHLLFATAFNGQASFAANIIALRNAGADVIVDDVGYFAEAVFQDDDVAAAVDSVVASGALYFSSAGNSGNLNDGTAGVWEGDFVASTSTIGGSPAHDFGGGVFGNQITLDSPYGFTLQWADPQGGSGNDYDLYLLNSAGTAVVAASTGFQGGNHDPFEIIGSSGNDTNRRLAVVLYAGANRFFHLNTNRGRLAIRTAGQTSGHAAARGAMGVAAVDVDDAGPGGVFDGTEPVETYSSDGPRRVFFEANGTAITPGNHSSTGGELRQKPDLAAADCVSTAAPGFSTFCGTSAAAPHAAAIAALLLELGGPGLTTEEVRSALADTALDIEASGVDRDSGAGIAEALAAAGQLAVTECSDGLDNDGDGTLDVPGDPGCTGAADTSEREAGGPACDDGADNNGNDLADFPADLGCVDAFDLSEKFPCEDGLDNDGDGLIDFGSGPSHDPGCENSFPYALEDPECSDGIDNDGDNLVDYPADPQCAAVYGFSETSGPGTVCGLLGVETLPLLAFALLRRARWQRRSPWRSASVRSPIGRGGAIMLTARVRTTP